MTFRPNNINVNDQSEWEGFFVIEMQLIHGQNPRKSMWKKAGWAHTLEDGDGGCGAVPLGRQQIGPEHRSVVRTYGRAWGLLLQYIPYMPEELGSPGKKHVLPACVTWHVQSR
jgi:hypothetical protein